MHRKFRIILATFLILALTSAINFPSRNASAETKEELQKQLDAIEQQIAQYQNQLNSIRGEKQSYQNAIKALQAEKNSLQLQIQATSLQIDNLSSSMDQTQGTIQLTEEQMQQTNEQIAELIRQLYEKDNQSLLEMMLADGSLAGSFQAVDQYEDISKNLGVKLDNSKKIRAQLDQQYADFADQQDQAKNLLSIQALQKNQLSNELTTQSQQLQATQGKESQYNAMLGDAQKQAAQIRNRIYDLLGVSHEITFGEAVKLAQQAQSLTGVRAAFLLAILTQESNLGKNTGTCNRAGDPPEKSWRVIMKPNRDQEPFQQITSELGLDVDTTGVSCPMHDKYGKQIGWGGAMGPAQFIPSTWMAHRDDVTALTGQPANPWDIRDAFIASALLLKANGAAANGENGEWAAAMRYFSGTTNPKYSFYGNSVMNLTHKYQADMDALAQ